MICSATTSGSPEEAAVRQLLEGQVQIVVAFGHRLVLPPVVGFVFRFKVRRASSTAFSVVSAQHSRINGELQGLVYLLPQGLRYNTELTLNRIHALMRVNEPGIRHPGGAASSTQYRSTAVASASAPASRSRMRVSSKCEPLK